MKDYACERVYRNARITSIYEGTTQLQVVAAIRHVTTGTYINLMRHYKAQPCKNELKPMRDMLTSLVGLYEEAVTTVTSIKDAAYNDFMARRLVEMAGCIIMSYLLIEDANRNDKFTKSAEVYTKMAQAEVTKHSNFIRNFTPEQLAFYKPE